MTKLRLRYDYVWESAGITPTYFGSVNGSAALKAVTPDGNDSDTFQVERANQKNAGSAINVENAGGIGFRLNQSGEGTAVDVSSDSENDVVKVKKNSQGIGHCISVENLGQGYSYLAEGQNGLVWAVNNSGLMRFSNLAESQSVGTAGSAEPLPATPATYIKIIGSDGNVYHLPAFKS